MSDQNGGVPHVDLHVACPIKGRIADAGVDVNIFRERGHLTGCTLLDKGETCGAECLITPEAHEVLTHIITTEQLKHKKDLGEVGPNVVA